ncbi:neuroglian-like isoform X2 [Coccinella septempunctata]|uniref:neuroglian-like isoform X2 n=1 Tax=Coccinella septempunctata TaxID=41139 RepID=UPI001D0722BA|nr:neuroglian-like isoform X2 [Coccinella septempunctata]
MIELGPPTGLKILGCKATCVHLGWTPRVFDDLLGKKVIIKIWNDIVRREYSVDADQISAWVPFIPNSKNSVSIAFASNTHEGEYSNVIQFRAPDRTDIANSSPQNFKVRQLGNSSVLLSWKKPEILIGWLKRYIIEYNQTTTGPKHIVKSFTSEDEEVSYKITDLKHGYYEFHLRTENSFGISNRSSASITLVHHISSPPKPPCFSWAVIETGETELDFEEACCSSEIVVINECRRFKKKVLKIQWHPNSSGNPGDRFLVRYRQKGQGKFMSTDVQEQQMYTVIDVLKKQQVYEVFVTSVDGRFSTDSGIQEVHII